MTPPVDQDWIDTETHRLLDFAAGSRDGRGGFGWLDDRGGLMPGQPAELWITTRMTHVFALGHLLGRPGDAALVDHGLAALSGVFHDPQHDGWWASLDEERRPLERAKQAYGHAFVVLAAASATVAERPGGRELLDAALSVVEQRFWDDDAGMVVDVWDEAFVELEPYRGVNANMHTVEAFLAAYDATGDRVWLDRAAAITERVVHVFARGNNWRIPEHFDVAWQALPDYNADDKAHQFRPYGATVGHWLEWARLALHVRAAQGESAPGWLLDDARSLFDASVREGWSADGSDGFVYTVDWSGAPVVRNRLHWVAAEAVATATALEHATGEAAYAEWVGTFWAHIRDRFVDAEGGSWWHELDPSGAVATSVWNGKPDAYHAAQATLFGRLPLAPTMARALADRAAGG